jgi:glycine oxidase
VIGCALAAELALRGGSVTIVERGEPGGEASSAAAGMLNPQAEARSPSPFFELLLESGDLFPEWSARLFEETGIDVGYRRTGLLECGFEAGGDAVFESYRWQRDRGLRVEDRPRESLAAEIDGRLSPEVSRAVFFPDEAVVDPPRLARAAWLAAERLGVRVLTATSATRFLVEGDVCRGVETETGPIAAQSVVDAAGAWAAFDRTGAPSVPVYPVRGQIVQLSVPGRPLSTVVFSDEVYIVPRPDGTVLLGSTVELVGFRKEVTAEAVERLLAAAIRLVPALASARFVTAWAGLRPGTPDGLPILGDSPITGLFFAAGHFRKGILLAPITARLVADAITGGPPRDLSAFSLNRFYAELRVV